MSAAQLCSIVCVKNAKATLGRTLDAVFAQTLPPGFGSMEVIVIDGGSTDGSAELACARQGVRLLRQQSHGLGAARNEAIRATTAPLIAFCDADDRWAEDSLAIRLREFKTRPDADAVIGQVVREAIDDDASSAAQQALIGVVRTGFTPGAMIARRSLFDQVGWFDETLRIGSDSDWFVRLTQSASRLTVIDDVVLYKGARQASLSGDVATYRRELLTVARRFIDRRRRDSPT